MIKESALTRLVFTRQHLLEPADYGEYNELFKYFAPVGNVYWIDPGSAPELENRAAFNDRPYNDERRGTREIVKGRYRNGTVGYVNKDEVALFAAAYMKPREDMSIDEGFMLDVLKKHDGITVGEIKKETGMLIKHITPLLHKLSSRFLAAEDQYRNGWEIKWYPFEVLYPDANVFEYTKEQAISIILQRMAYLYGFVSPERAKSLYGFTAKDVKAGANILLDKMIFLEERFEGQNGWILADDYDYLTSEQEPVTGVWAFNRSDPLVRINEGFLKGRYTLSECEAMYYVNVDGEFCGALMGRYNFTGNEHRDFITELDWEQANRRRNEIISALGRNIDLMSSPLMSYMGEAIF